LQFSIGIKEAINRICLLIKTPLLPLPFKILLPLVIS
jgi:hypothetical protein